MKFYKKKLLSYSLYFLLTFILLRDKTRIIYISYLQMPLELIADYFSQLIFLQLQALHFCKETILQTSPKTIHPMFTRKLKNSFLAHARSTTVNSSSIHCKQFSNQSLNIPPFLRPSALSSNFSQVSHFSAVTFISSMFSGRSVIYHLVFNELQGSNRLS